MTFSIVAYDPPTQQYGIAVCSRVVAIGGYTSYGLWGHGIIASQSLIPNYGWSLLASLSSSGSIEEVCRLIEQDPFKEYRQITILDRNGNVTYFEGFHLLPEYGFVADRYVSAQGNMLVNLEMLDVMVKTYQESRRFYDFPESLLRALSAGEVAGGDRRVERPWYSAGLLVLSPCEIAGLSDNCRIDLRVDFGLTPIDDLYFLYEAYKQQHPDFDLL
jgi:uncharacterized Ntn-hydrolase superfamily protein